MIFSQGPAQIRTAAIGLLLCWGLVLHAQAATSAYFSATGVQGLGNPQNLSGVNNTGQSVAFEINIDFSTTVDSETMPIVLWELGATGNGAALVLDNDDLHFFAGDDNGDVVTGAHGLSATTNGVQIVAVYEIDGGAGTDELLSVYVNGSLVASGEFATANAWAGSDAGGLGTVQGGAGGRFEGTSLFVVGDLVNYPTSEITLDMYVLASSGGPVDNTIANIVIPEPSALALMGLGLLGWSARRRR